MRTKFVARLLADDGALLAWATVWAEPRPQASRISCPFWPVAPTTFVIEQAGHATTLSVHWSDLDIARATRLMEAVEVSVGQVFNFAWTEPVWLVSGMRGVALPAVTSRQSVSIEVPPAQLGMAAGSGGISTG